MQVFVEAISEGGDTLVFDLEVADDAAYYWNRAFGYSYAEAVCWLRSETGQSYAEVESLLAEAKLLGA